MDFIDRFLNDIRYYIDFNHFNISILYSIQLMYLCMAVYRKDHEGWRGSWTVYNNPFCFQHTDYLSLTDFYKNSTCSQYTNLWAMQYEFTYNNNEMFNRREKSLIILRDSIHFEKKTYRELYNRWDGCSPYCLMGFVPSLVVITIIARFSYIIIIIEKMTGDRQIQIYLLLAL